MTPTMMMPRTDAAARPPQDGKREFLAALRSFEPASVLDVGCGEGALLRAVTADGSIHGVGIEPEEAAAEQARASGLEVR
ncbi:methionine biosynthesis protein MetW, partial [Inquilinus sp.]|uniref:methionine biosynthesis protein MetW n=1 Tax=Inquilinus sp. TaxID=1932117 RepID=UPI0031E38752